jgi:hypothetical protein
LASPGELPRRYFQNPAPAVRAVVHGRRGFFRLLIPGFSPLSFKLKWNLSVALSNGEVGEWVAQLICFAGIAGFPTSRLKINGVENFLTSRNRL